MKVDEMNRVRDDVVNLTASSLYKYRVENNYQAVLGEGSCDADIVFIGEAPGKNEAESGKPFCGRAGKILDELLASVDLVRDDIYITNIVKDRPPENRDPTESEIEMYAPYLDRQIDIIQPKVIATLGRYSMIYIMERFNLKSEVEPISAAHGKTYDAKASYGLLKIAPQYHPAASIYNQSLKGTLMEDFKLLKKLI